MRIIKSELATAEMSGSRSSPGELDPPRPVRGPDGRGITGKYERRVHRQDGG